MQIRLVVEKQHYILAKLAEDYGSNKAAAAYLGISATTFSSWLNLRYKPSGSASSRAAVVLLEAANNTSEKELFPLTDEEMAKLTVTEIKDVEYPFKTPPKASFMRLVQDNQPVGTASVDMIGMPADTRTLVQGISYPGVYDWDTAIAENNWTVQTIAVAKGSPGSPQTSVGYKMLLVDGTPFAIRPSMIDHQRTIGMVMVQKHYGWQSEHGWWSPKAAIERIQDWWQNVDPQIQTLYNATSVENMLSESALIDDETKAVAERDLQSTRDFIWDWPALVQPETV